MQQVTSEFLQWETSATSKEWIFATSNERILQRVTSNFIASNEQRVKSYASELIPEQCQ